MAMTTHRIAAHHHPITGLRAGLTGWMLRHSRRAAARFFERLRTSLPVTDPDRHFLENPVLEDRFAHLAIDHPDAVTPADGGATAAQADDTTLAVAMCDAWFREAHGPEQTWSPQTLATYQRLLSGVRSAAARSRGGAS